MCGLRAQGYNYDQTLLSLVIGYQPSVPTRTLPQMNVYYQLSESVETDPNNNYYCFGCGAVSAPAHRCVLC